MFIHSIAQTWNPALGFKLCIPCVPGQTPLLCVPEAQAEQSPVLA